MASSEEQLMPRWLQRLLYSAGAFAALIVVAVVTAYLFLKSPFGEALVADAIIGTLGKDGDVSVSIGDVEGDLPSSLTLKNISVQDVKGEWATINRLDVSWQPWALLSGRVAVQSLTADAVAVMRQPEFADSGASTSAPDVDALADLLDRFRVNVFRIEQADIAREVVGLSSALAVDASLGPGQSGDPQLMVSIAELNRSGEVSITAELARNQTIKATLEGELNGSKARAEGSFAVPTNTLTVTGEATFGSGLLQMFQPDSPIAYDTASAEFSVTGSVESPKVQLNYTVAQPRLGDLQLEYVNGTTDLVWSDAGLSVEIAGGVSGLSGLTAGLAPLVQKEALYALTANLNQEATVLAVEELSVESGSVAATFAGPIDLATLSGRGTATVRAFGLGRLAGWSDDQSETNLTIDISQSSPSSLVASLTGTATDITANADGLTALLSGPLDLNSDITLNGPVLQVLETQIGGSNAELSGSASIDLNANTLEGTVKAAVKTLSSLSHELSGAMVAEGSVSGPLATPNVVLQISGDRVDIRQETFEALDFRLTSDLAQSPRSAKLKGTVNIAEGPLALDLAVIQRDADHLRLAPLSIVGAGVSLKGALDASLDDGLVLGQVEAALDTLALPAAVMAVPVSGQATATADFTSVEGVQAISLTAAVEALRYGGATAGLRVLNLNGKWTGGGAPRIDLTLEGENGFVGTQAIASVSTTLAGPLNNLELGISARAPDDAPQLQLTGRLGVAESGATLALASLDLTDEWGRLSLESPTQLSFSNTQIATDEMAFTAAGGRLTSQINIDQTEGTVAASLVGENMPFDLLETLDPDLPITGRFGLSVILDGSLSAPNGSARLYTTDLSLPDTGLEDVGAELQATLTGQRLDLSGRVSGLSDDPATLTGSLPFAIDLTEGQARLPLDQPANLTVNWAGDIEPVWAILPLIAHRMTGEADIDLRLDGTLGDPLVTGYARLASGTYENLDLGTVLRELRVDLTADSASSVGFDLAGTDGDDGRITGVGRLNRGATGEFAGDVSVTLDRTRLVRRDDVKVRGSGTVSYAITPERDRIDGDIQVDSAEISLTATYAEAVPTLDVIDPDAPTPSGGPQRAGKETDLSISLTAPRGIDVVGRGLDSEWTADVTLGGTLAAPELNGSLDVSRGEFSFLGELFELTQGQVLFTGGGQIDPDLSVIATRSTAGITARVEVGGRASAPTITLGADPPLPQDEVLARIIFGKSAGQLGPLEAVQLANAAAELTGLTGRGGVVGTLRRGVGLDVFRFGSDAGGSTVVVGERLSRNVFVGVEQGLEGQGSQLIIEWQLTDNLGVKSTTRQDTGADIGLRWSRDY